MKKYSFGLAAILFAIGMVAFTNPRKLVDRNFIFTGLTTSQTQVEEPHNWVEGSASCDGTNAQACTILTVSPSFYHTAGSANVLNNSSDAGGTTVSITATLVGSTYYVSSDNIGGSSSVINKQ